MQRYGFPLCWRHIYCTLTNRWNDSTPGPAAPELLLTDSVTGCIWYLAAVTEADMPADGSFRQCGALPEPDVPWCARHLRCQALGITQDPVVGPSLEGLP